MISGTFQTRLTAEGVGPGKSALLQSFCSGLHKDLNGRVTLNDKASFRILCSYFLTLAAQTLMDQPHLLPTSHFSEGDFKKKKKVKGVVLSSCCL